MKYEPLFRIPWVPTRLAVPVVYSKMLLVVVVNISQSVAKGITVICNTTPSQAVLNSGNRDVARDPILKLRKCFAKGHLCVSDRCRWT